MSNKTRSQIKAQIYEYLPNINNSAHTTLLENLIDLAAEEISYRHNFRYLALTTPAEHDIVEGEYYVEESDFGFGGIQLNTYTSTMTGDETFTYDGGDDKIFYLDPNGADRTFNPSGNFPTGFTVKIYNTGTYQITFDSTDSVVIR